VALVDASANWWGTNTSSGVAALVTSNVDYTRGWTTAPTPPRHPRLPGRLLGPPRQRGQPAEWHHRRLQEAINLVTTGGTVYAHTGTYVEQLDIDHALTLTGDGPANTIIKSPAVLATKFTTGDANKPVVYVHNGTGSTTIEQLTVDGDGQGNANYRMTASPSTTRADHRPHQHRSRPRDAVQRRSARRRHLRLQRRRGRSRARRHQQQHHRLPEERHGYRRRRADLHHHGQHGDRPGTDECQRRERDRSLRRTGTIADNIVSGISYTPATAVGCGILIFGDADTTGTL